MSEKNNISENDSIKAKEKSPNIEDIQENNESILKDGNKEDENAETLEKNNSDPIMDDSAQLEKIIKHQKYLLALSELNKPENNENFEKYIRFLMDFAKISKENATKEAIGEVNTQVFQENLDALNIVAPDIVKKAEEKINNFDINKEYEKAGYEEELIKEIPKDFSQNMKTIGTFEEAFPDKDRIPLVTRLKTIKNELKNSLKATLKVTGQVLGDSKVQLGLSTIGFTMACAAGSATLPFSGIAYVGSLMRNKKVQAFANSVHKKTNETLVKFGIQKELVNDSEKLLGNRFKKLMESKWGKRVSIGLSVGLCGYGLHNLYNAIAPNIMHHFIEQANAGTIPPDFGNIANHANISEHLNSMQTGIPPADASVFSGDYTFLDTTNPHTIDLDIGSMYEIQTGHTCPPDVIDLIKKDMFANVPGSPEGVSRFAIPNNLEHYVKFEPHIPHDNIFVEPTFEDAPTIHASQPVELHQHIAPEPASPVHSATDSVHMQNEAPTTHASQHVDVQQHTAPEPVNLSNTTAIHVQKGDSAWDLASKHYQELTGNAPTDQQVTQMVDSLHLENPNAIHVGQTLHFTNDIANFHSYSGTVDFSMTTTNSSDVEGFYDAIVHEAYPNGTPELFNKAAFLDSVRAANPQLEDCYELGHHVVSVHYPSVPESQYMFHTIPGPAVDMVPHGGEMHHVYHHADNASNIHQSVEHSANAVQSLDTTVIVQKGDSAWDLASQHYQELTGNAPTDQQVTQMVDSLHLDNPNAIHVGQTLHFTNDISNFHSYSGTVDFSMTTTNSSDVEGFYDAIVHEAYPNGTPELFNKAAFLDSVRAANPQLEDCYELGHHVVSVHYPSVPESQYMFHTIPGPAVDMVPHGGEMHHVHHQTQPLHEVSHEAPPAPVDMAPHGGEMHHVHHQTQPLHEVSHEAPPAPVDMAPHGGEMHHVHHQTQPLHEVSHEAPPAPHAQPLPNADHVHISNVHETDNVINNGRETIHRTTTEYNISGSKIRQMLHGPDGIHRVHEYMEKMRHLEQMKHLEQGNDLGTKITSGIQNPDSEVLYKNINGNNVSHSASKSTIDKFISKGADLDNVHDNDYSF